MRPSSWRWRRMSRSIASIAKHARSSPYGSGDWQLLRRRIAHTAPDGPDRRAPRVGGRLRRTPVRPPDPEAARNRGHRRSVDLVGAADRHQQRRLVRLLRCFALLVRVDPVVVGRAAGRLPRHDAQPTAPDEAPQPRDDRGMDRHGCRSRERRPSPARRRLDRCVPHPGRSGGGHGLPHAPADRDRPRHVALDPRGGFLLGSVRHREPRRTADRPRRDRHDQRPADAAPGPIHRAPTNA
jgi:hypothetical protein